MIAAQEDAWRLIAHYLTDDDLHRFQTVAIEILSELDPAFELPPDQRYAASIYGKVLTRSGQLRNGIVETLALMATLSSEVPFMANRNGEAVAHSIVYRLLEKAKEEGDLWASLAYQLPLLAEAAPDIFLEAVEAGLSGEHPVLVTLFQDQASNAAFHSSSPHTGLLWALETLAWNPDYLGQSALCLARLAHLDPGGRLLNRPIKSLRDIFICWYPNTTALGHRLRVLDTIRKQEPKVAWQLLLALLPNHHSTVSPTHRIKWRDWVPVPRPEITIQEYFEATNTILEWLLLDAHANANRWCRLITAATGLKIEQQEILIQQLETLDPTQFISRDRVQICDCLRHETIRHRDYPDAKWAMPANYVERLEAIGICFEPKDLIERYSWLFKISVEIPERRRRSWEERENIIEELRNNALREILDALGWDGVLQLASQVKEPLTVGVTLSRSGLLPVDLGTFLQDNLGASEPWRHQMAQRYVAISAHQYGEQWIEHCILSYSETWSSELYGEFLLCLPCSAFLLNRLDTLSEEIQRYFWSRIQHIGFLEAGYINRLLTPLLQFERPHLAVTNVLSWALEHAPETISPEQIAEVLEVSVRTPPGSEFDISQFAYASAELLNHLEKTDLPRDRLIRLEWMYFRIHNDYRRPRILHEELAQNPEFFIEVLQYSYRAKNEPQVEQSEEAIAFVLLTHELLNSWHKMPGVQSDGSVDAEALHRWVMRVRELAALCDRSEIADIHIGHMLAFSPDDSDGAWPHTAVRELIEELGNPVIERGLSTQKFNNRGVTTRSPTDGGEQERALVEQYEADARQMSDSWSRTAALLRQIAKDYRRQATEHDQRAELTQDFWR